MSPTYLSPACVLCTVDHNGRYFSLWGYNDEQIIWHLYHQPTGTPIVTKTGDAYLKLSVKPGPTQASAEWALYMKNGMRVPPNPNTNVRFPVPNVGGLGHNVGMQRWIAAKDIELKPLKQYDYVAPRASYDARLVWEGREPLSALVRDRIRDTVDGSAAPIPSDVGEKVIICFGPCEVQPSIGGLVWRSKQVRPRKLGLLFCVADAIRKFMDTHTLYHNGMPVTEDQLYVVGIRRMSQGSFQPVLEASQCYYQIPASAPRVSWMVSPEC